MAMKTRPLTESEQIAQQNLRRIWNKRARPLGLTQQALADSWGRTQGYVGNMINGKSPISIVYAMRFAIALQVDARDIHPDLEVLSGSLGTGQSDEIGMLIELYRAASADARRAVLTVLYADVERGGDVDFIQNPAGRKALESDTDRQGTRGPGLQTPS
jgi:transcriptional regulator with XRE-family HTH domain